MVSVILWYVVDFFYTELTVANRPLGFDVEHCYRVYMGTVNESSPEFIADRDDYEDKAADRRELKERILRRPEVEAAALSQNSHPYNGSNSGGDFHVDTFHTSGYTITRYVEPDFLKVFRISGAAGETPEELAAKMVGNSEIVSENLLQEFGITDMQPYVGKDLYMPGDTTNALKIGGVARTMRYNDFMQGQMNRCVFVGMYNGDLSWMSELTVRVRDNMDKDFIENLMADSEKQFRVGNLYISRVAPFTEIRDNVLRASKQQMAAYMIGMGFLLLNIFLGLLGTFWFRTQQRVADIAVRMVSGATRRNVFMMLVCEGLLLLTVVTPVAIAIDVNLAHMELNSYLEPDGYLTWWRIALCGGITYVLMAVMIVAGIAFPAYRAMHIAPANALRSE